MRRSLLATLALTACLFACREDKAELTWQIEFESEALSSRAAMVEARIVKGGCGSEEIEYVSSFAPDEPGSSPPELGNGKYGFVARAQDERCFWYAQGCTDVDLPHGSEPVRVMISPLGSETLDCDACNASQCGGGSAGSPSTNRDADTPIDEGPTTPPDAGGPPSSDDDGGTEPAPDAAPPPEPVLILLEAEAAGEIQPPFIVVQDELASGGAYLTYPQDAAMTLEQNQALKRATPPADDAAGGLAIFMFEVPRSAEYRLWGRVIAPTLDEDSFWVRIDDGDWLQWNDISHQDMTWHWDDVRPFEMRADRFMVTLREGSHTLRISYRELGARIDRVVVASEIDWVPVD